MSYAYLLHFPLDNMGCIEIERSLQKHWAGSLSCSCGDFLRNLRTVLYRFTTRLFSLLDIMEQIFEDAKKNLYPRLALYEAVAKYKGEHERRRPASDRISETRRDFLDSFAYLCDIEKGGATVTAAGLQRLPYSNILWLAANEGIRSAVKSYANDLRDILVNMNSETEVKAREDVFQRAVQMCSPRLAFYKEELRTYATRCRMELRKELPDDLGRTS